MTQLRVTQKHVEGIAKRFTDVLANVNSAVDDVRNLLSPAGEPNVESQDEFTNLIRSAEILSASVDMLATAVVARRWQAAIEAVLNAEDPDARTMTAVGNLLRNALVVNARGLESVLVDAGPFAHAFRSNIVEQLADAVCMCSVLQASHETTEKLCADHGVDYVAVQAGDKHAIQQLLDVVEEVSGGPVSAAVYERFGLTPPAPPEPSVEADVAHTALADALGLIPPPSHDTQGPDLSVRV